MIDFILDYSFLISIGVFIAALIYNALFGGTKVALGLVAVSILTFLFCIIYPNFTYRPHHCNCGARFHSEANNVAAAIYDYFSIPIPTRTQVPSISDLVNSGNYVLFENRESKRRVKLAKELEFSVAILGDDVNDITIVVSTKKGRCPFVKGKCPWSKSQYFVKRMGISENSAGWFDSLEEFNSQI